MFRDDNYSLDSKSRFSDITEEINLDADEFIQVIMEAIKAEQNKNKSSSTTSSYIDESKVEDKSEESVTETPTEEPEEEITETDVNVDSEETDDIFAEEETDTEEEISKEDKLAKIKAETKNNIGFRAKASSILKANNIKTFDINVPDDVVDEIYSLI